MYKYVVIENPCYHCYSGYIGNCSYCGFRLEPWTCDLGNEYIEIEGKELMEGIHVIASE